MKLSDYCILFAGLFVCLFLGRDLRIASLQEQTLSSLTYEKRMDRIAEDALMDVVYTQLDDGTLVISMSDLEQNYERLIERGYDLTDEDCSLRVWEALALWQFGQYPYAWSASQLDAFRDELQQQMNEGKRARREASRLSLEFPYISGDDWYQMPSGAQLFTSFDPREEIGETDRVIFSAGRIVKLKNSIVETRKI